MALRFVDSFDHYTAIGDKWTAISQTPLIVAGAARTGIAGMRQGTNNNQNMAVDKVLDSQATWIVGVAIRFESINANAFIQLRDAGSAQMEVRFDATDKLTVTRNGTLLGTGTTTLLDGLWYYVEFKTTIHNSTGIAVVRLNGVTEINLSGQDTQNTANATADTIRIGAATGATVADFDYDDLYVCDGTGSAPTNDFLGDVRVDALLPNGNGNSSQFDGSDGNSTDNYLLVDEADPDDDTTYVESADVGDKDTYAFSNLTPTSGTVYGVQPLLWSRKADAGSRQVCSVARLSGTEVDSSNHVLLDSYRYTRDVREAKPGGGVWTITDVNNAEFGMKVTV